MASVEKQIIFTGYLGKSIAQISHEIQTSSPPEQRLMRALRANPFDRPAAIAIAMESKDDITHIKRPFSNEAIPVKEVALVAEELYSANKLFSWAIRYATRDVSRIAAILEGTYHPGRIMEALLKEIRSGDLVRIEDVCINPNLSKNQRLNLAHHFKKIEPDVYARLTGQPLPKRISFFGIPLCAGNLTFLSNLIANGFVTKEEFGKKLAGLNVFWPAMLAKGYVDDYGALINPVEDLSQFHFNEVSPHTRTATFDFLHNAHKISAEEIAQVFLQIPDVYLKRALLSTQVTKVETSAEILSFLPEDEAVKILMGMSNGILWNYLNWIDMSDVNAKHLLKF